MASAVPPPLLKYPRTQHVAGSRLQPGDEDLSQVRFSDLAGEVVVVEEKLDGAAAAVSFDDTGNLWLQSRGHYLTGGWRERHFAQLKRWATSHSVALRDMLGENFVMYGEFMAAKHTEFYDALPHLFLEFDVLDRRTGRFLDTPSRYEMLASGPVVSVPVLHRGTVRTLDDLKAFVGPSLYKTSRWRDALAEEAERAGVDPAAALAQTDDSDLSEGLYLKVERDGEVTRRLKWVRADFHQAIMDSGGHWQDRPIIRNRLAANVDLFAS